MRDQYDDQSRKILSHYAIINPENPISSVAQALRELGQELEAMRKDLVSTVAREVDLKEELEQARRLVKDASDALNSANSNVKRYAERAEAAEKECGELAARLKEAQNVINCKSATITEIDAKLSAMAELVNKKSDRAYLDYMAQDDTVECMGECYKLAHGQFNINNLNAHRKAAEILGMHRAYSDILKALSATATEGKEGE